MNGHCDCPDCQRTRELERNADSSYENVIDDSYHDGLPPILKQIVDKRGQAGYDVMGSPSITDRLPPGFTGPTRPANGLVQDTDVLMSPSLTDMLRGDPLTTDDTPQRYGTINKATKSIPSEGQIVTNGVCDDPDAMIAPVLKFN